MSSSQTDPLALDTILQEARKSDRLNDVFSKLEASRYFKTIIKQYIKHHHAIFEVTKLSPEQYKACRAVLAKGLHMNHYPFEAKRWLDIEITFARNRPDYVIMSATQNATNLIETLVRLKRRIITDSVNETGAKEEQDALIKQEQFTELKKELAASLYRAATILDTGEHDDYTLVAYTQQSNDPEDEVWCSGGILREWADHVRICPVEDLFPVSKPPPNFFPLALSCVRTKGSAFDPNSALTGAIIREISYHVLDGTTNRFAAIASLCHIIGLNVARQNVRSLLLGGKT